MDGRGFVGRVRGRGWGWGLFTLGFLLEKFIACGLAAGGFAVRHSDSAEIGNVGCLSDEVDGLECWRQ